MKRILSLIIVVCLTAALCPAVFAADVERTSEQALALAALDIMAGDASGNLNLGGSVTRGQFAKMAVMASPSGKTVGSTALVSPFYDVPASHWAASYVATARDLGLMRGYLDGLFHPGKQIRLEEGVKTVLALLGYSDSDVKGAYPVGHLALYAALDLDEGVKAKQGQYLTRGDVQNLFYNLLSAKTKEGAVYLTTLGYTPTAEGKVDIVALINEAMSEPVVAQTGWQDAIPFAGGNSTYYRNGKAVASSAIAAGDVLYYNKSLRTVWAYNNPVSGTITELKPSAAKPTSVVIGGVEYRIGSAAAALELSDLGGAAVGDAVTLLLGRDNSVVAIGDSMSVGDTVRYGVVLEVSRGSFTDAQGNQYTSDTIKMKATDGGIYTYPVTSGGGRAPGDLVKIAVSGGKTTASGLGGASISGRVSSDGKSVGGTPFAENVQILDAYKDSGVVVFPTRLAGISLDSGMVRFVSKNASGEIDKMILNNATGDVHQYGIVSKANKLGADSSAGVAYELIVNGQKISLSTNGVVYPVRSGDSVQLRYEKGQLTGMTVLEGVGIETISGNEIRGREGTYLLSDAVAVYVRRDESYFLSSLTAIQSGDYQLRGYWDKSTASGGRIRILVAS